jgi:hypothetical protein
MKRFDNRTAMAKMRHLFSNLHPILYILGLGALGVLGALGD